MAEICTLFEYKNKHIVEVLVGFFFSRSGGSTRWDLVCSLPHPNPTTMVYTPLIHTLSNLSLNDRERRVLCPEGTNWFSGKYTARTEVPAGVNPWRFNREKVTGDVYSLGKNMNMNAALNVNVLKDQMLPFYEIHRNASFLQDSAPCHRPKHARGVVWENASVGRVARAAQIL